MSSALYCLLHSITCSLPIAGTSLFAWILVSAQRTSGFAITKKSVSQALAAYPDYDKLLVLVIVASSLIFATTAVRNVQVRIWFRRRYGSYLQSCCCCCCPKRRSAGGSSGLSKGSATSLAFTNDVASVVNILAYVSFLLLVIYPADAPTEVGRMIHQFATIGYFALSIVYGIMQVTLTWNQGNHYPSFVRIVQLLLTIAGVGLSVVYGITYFATDNPIFLAEWIIVALNLVFIAFFSIMFHIDSASDELIEFVCPCCCGGGGEKRGTKKEEDSYYRGMP